jgi:alpha-1,2-mannosyltransferase
MASAMGLAERGRLLDTLRSGRWVTPVRIRTYSIALVGGYSAAIIALGLTAHGALDYAGRPLGADFADVWAAGRLALAGRAAAAYDPAVHYAAQQAAFHRLDVPDYSWAYPPQFLWVAAALASLPYLVALAVWQAATAPLYLATVRAIVPRREALLPAIAFPGAFMTLIHGQNAFLTVALLAGGLLVLERRPILAGVLFGLLAYKPQFGLILPLVLACAGRWKTFAAAAATVLATAAACTLIFGVEIWRAFLDNLSFARTVFLEDGSTGFHKLQSAFAAVRLWSGSIALAYAVQGAVAVAVAGATVLLWRSAADMRLKSAGLVTACLLATPYSMDYDLALLGPALAWVTAVALERGFRPYEASFLALVYVAPICTRNLAHATLIPLGFMATAGLLGLVLQRAVAERGGCPPSVRARDQDLFHPRFSSENARTDSVRLEKRRVADGQL